MPMDVYVPNDVDIIHQTKVDFRKRTPQSTVHLVQYERSLPVVEVELFYNGYSYTCPNNAEVWVRWSKLDGTYVYKICQVSADRKKVYFDIDYQMSYLPGDLNPILELQIGTKMAGSSPIPISIDRNPIQDGDRESHVEDLQVEILREEVAEMQEDLDDHINNTNNPHGVTKAQVGLGNADNTSDANKPVSTAQQAEFLKAKYHLGAFDTVDTSDPVYDVITRNTGYIDMGDIDYYGGNQYSWGRLYRGTIQSILITNAHSVYSELKCSKYGIERVNDANPNNEAYLNKVYQIEGITEIGICLTDTALTDEQVQASVRGALLQFRLATPYTEKVIKNQPLNTLDQRGSEFVRKEWEKTQNLMDLHINQSLSDYLMSVNLQGTLTFSFGGTFTIATGYENAWVLRAEDSNGNYYYMNTNDGGSNPKQFTSSGTIVKLYIRGEFVATGSVDIMVNEGDHAYPYVPYNANKHITNDQATFLKNEFDKSCNSYSGSQNIVVTANNQEWASTRVDVVLKPNTKYTIKFDNVITGSAVCYLSIYDGTSDIVQISDTNAHTFTTTSVTTYQFYFHASKATATGTSTYSNIMLNEGSVALSYQPYNGAIVHEKDIENVVRKDVDNNFTTRQTISTTDDTGLVIKVPNAYAHDNIMFLKENMQQLGNIGFNTSYKPEIYSMLSHSFVDLVIATDLDPINDLLAELKTIVYDNQYPAVAEIDLTYATYYALPSQISGDKIIMSAGMDMTKVKGRSYVVNNQCVNGTFNDSSSWSAFDSSFATLAVSNNKATMTIDVATGAYWEYSLMQQHLNYVLGHKLWIHCKIESSIISLFRIEPAGANSKDVGIGEHSIISSLETIYNQNFLIFPLNDYDNVGNSFSVSNVEIVDLTQWFGSNDAIPSDLLADPSLFTKKYWKKSLPYDTGHIEDSKPVKVIATGFNKFDEELEEGVYSYYDGGKAPGPSGYMRNKNFIRVNSNTTYYRGLNYWSDGRILFYDKDKNFISITSSGSAGTFTTPANCCYITFFVNYGSSTYNHDICINISDPLLNGKYLPFKKDERTIIPIDMGTVDLGTLDWVYDSELQVFKVPLPSAKKTTSNVIPFNGACTRYPVCSVSDTTTPKISGLAPAVSQLYVYDPSMGTDATAFKNAMRGETLTFELATQSHNPLRSAGSVQDDNEKVKIMQIDLSNMQNYLSFASGLNCWILNMESAGIPLAKWEDNYTTVNGLMWSIGGIPTYYYDGEKSSRGKITVQNGSGYLLFGTGDSETKPTGIVNYEMNTYQDQSPSFTLPENIEIQKGGTIEIEYDDGYSTPCDVNFEVAVSKVLED